MPNKVTSFLSKGIDRIAIGGAGFAGMALIVCAAVICYEVIVRYIFNAPTNWTLDLSIYLVICFAFSSMSYVQKEGYHVHVDVVVSRLSPRTKAFWDVVVTLLFLIFACLMLYFGTKFALTSFGIGEFSREMWKVIIWPIKAAVPIGGLLLSLVLLKELIIKLNNLSAYPDDKGASFLAKPIVVVPIFVAAIIGSLFLMTINGIAGMVVLMLILLFGGVPIFPALGLIGVSGTFLLFGGISGLTASFAVVSYGALENFALVSLPLFILVGQIVQKGGVGEEIYNAATKWVGHLPGGEAIATILACSVFAAISSSSVATAVTIGLIALPALAIRKYNKPFSYGLLAAGGTLGIMIPPSGTMIIYSAVTEESLGKLFLAGFFPGLILAAGFIAYSILRCWRTGEYEKQLSVSWRERFLSLKTAFWGLMAPVIILGGIYSGIFTPLESGAIAVLYVLGMVVARRKIKLRDVPNVLANSTLSATMVMSIVIGAIVLGNYMTLQRIPDMTMELALGLDLSPWGMMAAIILLLTILGMFLEIISVMLITLPVIYPIIISLGFDGIWFAVIMTLTMEMALLTPPVGLNLYVITGITKAPLTDVLRGVIPFFLIMVLGLVLFYVFPQISMWLPGAMIAR